MSINISTWVALIYISFALDSALKLGGTVQFHLGIICIAITNVIATLRRPSSILHPLKKETSLIIFILYSLISGALMFQPGFINITVYLLVTINIIIFASTTFRFTSKKIFYLFQITMILTGLFQYAIFKIGGVQLSFINEDHYEKGYSVSFRLRGFFIEPNWFAISFSFNTLLLTGSNVIKFIKRNPCTATLTALVMILNGSLTTIGALTIIYSIPIIKKTPIKGTLFSAMILSVLIGVISYRSTINPDKDNETLLNYASRWIPLTRVIEYQTNQSLLTILFGHGLGSWGTTAVNHRLSALVNEEDPSARDGSELPVFIFELGLFGLALLLLDFLITYSRTPSRYTHIRGGLVLFIICLVFYPTLKFWMYMPYYFYLRRARYETASIQHTDIRRHKDHLILQRAK
ncbi:hypothetical protein [Pseudomonas nitroreducens]|uniref:O-antigen ligase family protein n=1 Tax=Pseudomonas nitroreducens TaxID=46680 RepID=A0ABS0KHS9_PSENT|nr:hypothetical protein [Pseudomonas nitroreducens]MBG6287499.1 hypothetical protein [Pseudomonas nitroreducens]NMZ61359.1 hypothetical protein [Pseudomonas nitroreducens]